jgi:NTP pyrophosphatase (non-canonical NTP hydrolase)
MPVSISRFQDLIRRTFGAKDSRRGIDGTFLWFVEEVGELAAALRGGSPAEQSEEFADVLAWLVTLANSAGVDLEAAVERKYENGCPTCRQSPCRCDPTVKP